MLDMSELIQKREQLIRERRSQRELAELECEILAKAPVEIERSRYNDMFAWQAKLLDETVYSLRTRRDLLIAGKAAHPLWVHVDNGMPLGTAARILREARQKRSVIGYERAVDEELSKRGYKVERVTSSPETEPDAPEFIGSSKALFNMLRTTLNQHLTRELSSMPPQERELLVNEFERDVSALISLHKIKWRRMADTQREQKMITRAQFHGALLTLHMDPPKHSTPLAQLLKQANKQRRSLARMYHPDMHGGSEETLPQYKAVIEAFLIIQQYVQENENRPTLRVVGGKED